MVVGTRKRLVSIILCFLLATALFTATAGAASGSVYENENNNSYTRANRTYDDYDSYGLINSYNDIDYWVVSFSHGGLANFFLGNIPSGKNYNMYIYSSNGTSLLRSSTNTGNADELITLSVSANTNYYIKIASASGSSTTSFYLFRTKVYSSKTLEVPLYAQQTNSTCGPASGRMVLGYYGINVTEADYIRTAEEIINDNNDSEADYTYVWVNTNTINKYLIIDGKSTQYHWKDVSSYSAQEFTSIILRNILNGYPVQLPMKFYSPAYFQYTSSGHYMVIKGMQYDTTSIAYNSVMNDPYNGGKVFSVPIGVIQSYNNAHSSFIICVLN